MKQKKLQSYATKLKRLFEKVDAIFIKNGKLPLIDENFFYFTKLEGIWENSILIIYPDKMQVIAPPLEKGEYIVYRSKEEMEKILKEILNVDKIGFNGEALPYKDYLYLKKITSARLFDISKHLKRVRLIKNEHEIGLIKKACKISLHVLNEMDFENKNEMEASAEIEYRMKRYNATPSFNTIVAFGRNSATPHHKPGKKKFCYPFLVDLGAKYKNYCSDITRSFVKRKGKKLYEIVENALHIAMDEMFEGIKANELYKKIEEYFGKYGLKMKHSLGHSIGINVHDGYSINEKANFEFKKNMVFAVEPAIYEKEYGIRIEEDVVVGKNKAIVISR